MANINSSYQEARIPFAKMTFSPDVPATALGPNEYNAGLNVETDVRGIRSVAGDEEILNTVPGTPTFMTGGYRLANEFWFIVATDEGYWWASNGVTDWYNITPGGGPISGYGQATNITEAWSGTIPFFNDTVGAPMFLPDAPGAILTQYSNLIKPVTIDSLVVNVDNTVTATYGATTTGSSIALDILTIGTLVSGTIAVGQYVLGTGVAPGTTIISNISGSGSGSTWKVSQSQTVASTAISIAPYTSAPYIAGQQVLISGINNFFNGTFVVVSSTTTEVIYAAVPGAGVPNPLPDTALVSPAYTWNYNPNWKSVVAGFLRIYNSPNVGSILVAGNLTATLLDDTVVNYPVTVQWSQAFGLNQAPLTWQPTITNIANQLEVPLRGACVDAFAFNGQFFLCSYWDTVVFSPINYTTTSAPILGVRLFNQGRGLLTSNSWANTDRTIYGIDARDVWVFDGNDFTGLGNQRVKNWFFDQLDPAYVDRLFMDCNTQKNQIEIYYTTKPEYANANNPIVGGVPNKMISYRYDLDVWNPPRDVSSATFSCESPIWSYSTGWTNNSGSRTIVYAPGRANKKLLQKDTGFSFVTSNDNPTGAIQSYFRRDNIKLIKDYSGKVMVHRVLPEVENLNGADLPINVVTDTAHKGNITVTIEGANSTASAPTVKTPVTIPIDANGNTVTQNPWAQINQNAFRVNNIELSNSSNSTIWMCNATTWQITQVEDDR